MHLLLVAVWAFVGVNLTTGRTINEVAREVDGESARIVGGADATKGQFPYAAALHYNGSFICTASILSPTTILTAAHCVVSGGVQGSADSFYLIANVSRVAQTEMIDVARVIPHPEYDDRSMDNDIAILKTTSPIPFSDEVKQVCIAGPDTEMMQYRNATAMGWGNISRVRFIVILPERLRYVEQKIVGNNVCSFLNTGVNEDKICATGFFTGVCIGDSGGPLVHLSADKPPVEIGIASYINALVGCGKISPAVFTRVSSHYDFIMQAADDSSICVV